ncbi:MAG: hypothetical protein AAGG51_21845 [Cyanobacteria bacterium P01_G01_bin.54]
MSTVPPSTSTCRFCCHYCPQGRRGGMCQQLGGRVEANWHACQLAQGCFGADELLPETQWLETPRLRSYPARPIRSPQPISSQTAA